MADYEVDGRVYIATPSFKSGAIIPAVYTIPEKHVPPKRYYSDSIRRCRVDSDLKIMRQRKF